MKYSRWLKTQYPHLVNENDVTVQNFIKQAKDDTKKELQLLSLHTVLIAGVLGYVIGYLLGRYSSLDGNVRFLIILIYAVALFFLSKKLEQRLIKKRLAQLLAG
tara:strand:+ start:1373 stop:1684 length:312 start_codon:yes stop_codon:yes gene_type:complete